MDHLWTPWRKKYVQGQHDDQGCIFCMAAAAEDGVENLIFFRGIYNYMILNRYPYTNGHLMCVPYAHEERLEDLDRDTRVEMMDLITKAVRVLKEVYHPEGFNIGLNLGEIAGAGVAEHLHMHIVPRWAGDTNFMTAVGSTRVLPESLVETYQRVSVAWEEMA